MVPGIILFALVGLTPHDLYRDEHIFVAMNAFRFIVPSTLFLLSYAQAFSSILVIGCSFGCEHLLCNFSSRVRIRQVA